MALSVKIDIPAFPKGEMLAINGLGLFENGGKAVEIPEDAEVRFVAENGMHVKEAFQDTKGITVTGTKTAKDADKLPEPAVNPDAVVESGDS